MNMPKAGFGIVIALKSLVIASFLVGLLALGTATVQASAAPELVFAGAGSALAITRVLADEFRRARPGVGITIPPSIGSTGGARAAADGAVALGMIARPLSDKEAALGLRVIPLGRVPLVIAASTDVPDEDITRDDLVRIYRGTRNRWRDGSEIIVLTRQPEDSFITELTRKIPGFGEAYTQGHRTRRWVTFFSDHEMNAAVVKTPQAIGLTDLATLTAERPRLKPLRLDGVAPSAAALVTGRYPLEFPLSFVVRPDRVTPEVRAFLDFVASPAGVRLLRAHGVAEPTR